MQDIYKKSISTVSLDGMLGKTKNIEQMPTRNGKGTLQNHVIHHCEHGTKFVSYGVLIAAKIGKQLYVSDYHDYSETTAYHCKRYTGLTLVERREALKNGTIIHINVPC